jgi:hypothetical protein
MTSQQHDTEPYEERDESRWATLHRRLSPGLIAMGWVAGVPLHPAILSVVQGAETARRRGHPGEES